MKVPLYMRLRPQWGAKNKRRRQRQAVERAARETVEEIRRIRAWRKS